ncbi:MAG TPA: hypothetical protein VMH33_07670 [Solirubrobacterales bacterium]|nr:hypothetical protein [Solirubrobacterales bacterium]
MSLPSRYLRPLAALLCTLALVLVVAACGGGGSSSTTTASNLTPTQKKAKKELEEKKKKLFAPFPAGHRYFSDKSPWNTEVESLPEDSNSEEMLELARRRIGVIEQPGRKSRTVSRVIKRGFALNTVSWAPVIVEVDEQNGVQTTLECRQVDCGAGIQVPKTLKLPAGAHPDPRFDGWMSLIDREKGIGYDLWRARRQDDGVITFQFSKAWALRGPGFSKPISEAPARAVGARGSGLPLFAGVVEPGELKNGEIDHALSVSVPGLARRRYVQPASVTDGVGPVKALPAGARIRLKADVKAPEPKLDARKLPKNAGKEEVLQARQEEGEHRYVEAILATLRRYGAIVVDRAAVPTLYAQDGQLTGLIEGNALEWLHLDNFEVVALPKVRYDPPAGKAAARAAKVARPATNGGF